MNRSATTLVLVSLVVITFLPATQAGFIPTYGFHGELPALKIGEQEDGRKFSLGVVTGETTVEGSAEGLFGFFGPTRVVATNVRRVEVLPAKGNSSEIIDRLPKDELGVPTQAYLDAFDNATITITEGTSFLYYTPRHTQTYSYHADFSLGLPALPPRRLADESFDLEVGTSLVSIGDGRFRADFSDGGMDSCTDFDPGESFQSLLVGNTTVDELTANLTSQQPSLPILYPFAETATVMIAGEGHDPVTFTGKDQIFCLIGAAHLEVEGRNSLLPFGPNVTATFRPGPSAALQSAFDLSALQDQIDEIRGDNSSKAQEPVLDEKVQDIFKSLAPLLNGAMVGNFQANVVIHEKDVGPGAFTLLRYESLTMRPNGGNETVSYEGRGQFFLAGNALYSEKAVVGPALFPIPTLSLFLWVLAIAAIVVGFTLKPVMASGPGFLAGVPVRILAIVCHVLLFILAFILWDLEVKSYLGTSILQGQGGGIGFLPIILIEVVGFSFAGLFFGLPIRFLINSGLKIIGMKQARGLGKGIGNLSQWFLGAAFLPVFLNPAVQTIFQRISP